MADLIHALSDNGIEPVGCETYPNVWTEHRVFEPRIETDIKTDLTPPAKTPLVQIELEAAGKSLPLQETRSADILAQGPDFPRVVDQSLRQDYSPSVSAVSTE